MINIVVYTCMYRKKQINYARLLGFLKIISSADRNGNIVLLFPILIEYFCKLCQDNMEN